ncbi:MAG: oligopeptide transport system permease protein [Thermomicrobiales bacterium]|nr:oligopeptide transport system permease protein [Thermomicrobiales bacterium]
MSSTAVSTAPALEKETRGLAALSGGRTSRSLWSNAWRQFRRNKMAMAGVIFLFLLAIVAVTAPLIAPHNPVQSDVKEAGRYRQAAWVDDANPKKAGRWDYPLGTDAIGRDVFSRLVYGTRISLVVGFIPMAVILLIGVPVGLAAGYLGGRVDNMLMRLTDVVYAFPALLFFIVMQISFGDTGFGRLLNGLILLFVTLSVVNWTGVARLVRGTTLSLKEKEFVEAARASGATGWRIILRHILPNALGPIIVAAAFIVPGAIIAEAVLTYLGIGLRPDVNLNAPFPSSWGQMIQDGKENYNVQAWMLIAPSVAVGLITLAFTFVGDGLRDALDPREQL